MSYHTGTSILSGWDKQSAARLFKERIARIRHARVVRARPLSSTERDHGRTAACTILSEKVRETEQLCFQALATEPLATAVDFLQQTECTDRIGLLILSEAARTQSKTMALKRLYDAWPKCPPGILERALLVRAALSMLRYVDELPVDSSVKKLIYREFAAYAQAPVHCWTDFSMHDVHFYAMSQLVLFDRFPAGQEHWVVSGFPRTYIRQMSPGDCSRALRFIALQMGGCKPYFVIHLAGTVFKSSFLSERKYVKSFCRMALALEQQPNIKGVMVSSWLHSHETHRVSPHLAFLNRPFLESGGLYVDLKRTDGGHDFRVGSEARSSLFDSGQYRPNMGLLMCSRTQAISWMRDRPNVLD